MKESEREQEREVENGDNAKTALYTKPNEYEEKKESQISK